MQSFRAYRRLATCIALLAIALASLLPSLRHAVAAASGSPWTEICTADGAKWVNADDDRSEPGSKPVSLQDPCPYGAFCTPALVLPSASRDILPPSPLRHHVPLAFLAAPRTLHAWVSAQPRAPPPLS
ncbi:MAG: DUF2946 family protein [Rubrivivax sp.]